VNKVALTYISALVRFLHKIVTSVRGYEQHKLFLHVQQNHDEQGFTISVVFNTKYKHNNNFILKQLFHPCLLYFLYCLPNVTWLKSNQGVLGGSVGGMCGREEKLRAFWRGSLTNEISLKNMA
jgi:hypothetical protein